MAISKFIIARPDLWVTGVGTTDADKQPAKLGHINRVVNYLNTYSPETVNKTATLSSGASTSLTRIPDAVLNVYPETAYLQGSTPLLIPISSNCVWQVTVDLAAVAKTAGGAISVGDSYGGKFVLTFKRVNGTSSVVGVNQAISSYDASLESSQVTFAAGTSQDLLISFVAPTTASGINFAITATIDITQTTF
ncbi:MAG: hypothetical protein ACOVOV_05525 [Dolichospermum sp.]